MTSKNITLLGIGASAILVAVIVIALVAVHFHQNSIGEATDETAPAILKKIDLHLDLAKLITPPPEDGTSAEALYQEAVKQAATIDDFANKVTASIEPEKDPALKPILDKIEEAADKPLGAAPLDFSAILPTTPSGEWRNRDFLYAIGKLAGKAGTSMRSDKNREGSEKALRAGLIYGDRLFHNGVFVPYKSAGLGSISEALASYERDYSPDFFSDPAKLAVIKDLQASLKQTVDVWIPKEKLVRRIGPLTAPGDLWNMAEHDQDPAWRLDGIMWLGVAKWTETGEGPQRTAIENYLEQKAKSTNPVVAKTAADAVKFSKMDIRTFRID